MEVILGFVTIGAVTLLAAMSPGPDFAIVMKNSLLKGRRAGIASAIGIGMGVMLHVSYLLLGIGLIVSQSIILFNVIKFAGAVYLIYLGVQLLFRKRTHEDIFQTSLKGTPEPFWKSVQEGFLTNALNPKATLFFLGVFTQIIEPTTPILIQVGYGVEMAIIGFLWFAFLAYAVNISRAKSVLDRWIHYIERAMGAALIGLGMRMALSTHS